MQQAETDVTRGDDSRVILCRPHYSGLASSWDEKGGYEQTDEGPPMIVIGSQTTDEKCMRLAKRFGLDADDLMHFRENVRDSQGYRVDWTMRWPEAGNDIGHSEEQCANQAPNAQPSAAFSYQCFDCL